MMLFICVKCLCVWCSIGSGFTLWGYQQYSVRGITVLCHFLQNDQMPVITCKYDKRLVTHYNVIFSNIKGILSHLNDILY